MFFLNQSYLNIQTSHVCKINSEPIYIYDQLSPKSPHVHQPVSNHRVTTRPLTLELCIRAASSVTVSTPVPDRMQKKKKNTHLAGNNILPITLVPFFRLNGNFPARLNSRLLLSYDGNSRLISTFDLNLSGHDILRCVRFNLSFFVEVVPHS